MIKIDNRLLDQQVIIDYHVFNYVMYMHFLKDINHLVVWQSFEDRAFIYNIEHSTVYINKYNYSRLNNGGIFNAKV